LLPTPSAYESTPTDEYNDEVREHLLDSHRRLYLPGRKWHSQRTLSRMAGALLPTPSATQNDGHDPEVMLARRERERAKGRNGNGFGLTLGMAAALLPTPGASDDHGGEGPTRDARRAAGTTGGPTLKDIAHLLPTPTSGDHKSTRNKTGDDRGWERGQRHSGTTLTDAASQLLPTPTTQDGANTGGPSQLERNSLPLNAVAPTLLPTPQAADGHGGRLDNEETFESGRRPSGSKASRTLRSTLHHKLLPTPTAEDGERGQGADAARQWGPSLRGAVQPEVEAARNPHTMWATMGRVRSGDHTSQPSSGGKPSSGEAHPDQLTIEAG
jgi:hypothetical protein